MPKQPKFSVITPVHVSHSLREKQLVRAMKSLTAQSFRNFEWIVINDGSLKLPKLTKGTKRITQTHQERIIAYNKGLKKAKGEWIVFLDSDDEFIPHYLECVNQMIEKNPDYKLFNYASIHVRRNYGTAIRGVFKPKEEKVGHEVFGDGNIVNGTFCFHRSVYLDLGGYPETKTIPDPSGKRDFLYMSNPWDFSIAAQIEFPEIVPLFTAKHPDHPKGVARELGNPWGNDYYIFYKYTRKYHSKPYDIPLYIVHGEGKLEGEHHVIE